MENDQAQGVLDLESPTDCLPRIEVSRERPLPDQAEGDCLDAVTACQDIQIRRLEDLGSWNESVIGDADQVKVLQEIHRSDPLIAHRLAQAAVAMPEVGTEFLGFRLIQEVGKGAFARVYLAHQGDLADRLVI